MEHSQANIYALRSDREEAASPGGVVIWNVVKVKLTP